MPYPTEGSRTLGPFTQTSYMKVPIQNSKCAFRFTRGNEGGEESGDARTSHIMFTARGICPSFSLTFTPCQRGKVLLDVGGDLRVIQFILSRSHSHKNHKQEGNGLSRPAATLLPFQLLKPSAKVFFPVTKISFSLLPPETPSEQSLL